jgi:mycofactocin precursor
MDAVEAAEAVESLDESNHGEPAEAGNTEPMLVEELLVEEVSIDGMCGVY